VRGVTTSLLKVPTDKLITDSIHRLEAIEVVVTKISTDEDLEGTGFTYTIGTGGSAIKAIIDDVLSPLILGENPDAISELWAKMWKATNAIGRGGVTSHAVAAVDIALWDLKGKYLNRPLYSLLGGSRKPIPLYDTDGGWLHYTEEQLVRNALEAKKSGFKGFKMKVGKREVEEDLKRIRAVQSAVGGSLRLMIDANQAWPASEALSRGRKYERLDLDWYEEPTIADDVWGHRKIAEALDLPIAVGETIFTKYEFNNYVRLNACDILQPDVCRVGGITEWLQVAETAEVNGLPVSPHFVMDLHVSLVASITNGLYVEYIPWMRKILSNPPIVDNGYILPPDSPGIGFEIKDESIQKYKIS
jgi:L-alanine-DL-glutamate epimerase-like enolase superfamily enzyme